MRKNKEMLEKAEEHLVAIHFWPLWRREGNKGGRRVLGCGAVLEIFWQSQGRVLCQGNLSYLKELAYLSIPIALSHWLGAVQRKHALGLDAVICSEFISWCCQSLAIPKVRDLRGAFSGLLQSIPCTIQLCFSIQIWGSASSWFLWACLPEEELRRKSFVK